MKPWHRTALRVVALNVGIWLLLEGAAWGTLAVIGETRPTPRPAPARPGVDMAWFTQTRLAFDAGLYEWDEHCLWRMVPHYSSGQNPGRQYWGRGPLVLNELGLRHRSTTTEKPPGTRRVLVLGGSHPLGMYVNPEEAYSAVLERYLNGSGDLNGSGGLWEVINAAVPGFTSFQGRQWLEQYGLELQPDLVIADLGVNDTLPLTAEFPLPDSLVRRPPAWAVKASNWLHVSAVYRLILRLREQAAPPGATQRVSAEEHAANVEAMRALGREHGFSVLAVGQFTIDVHGPGATHCLFAETGPEPFVDLCAYWRGIGPAAKHSFVDPVHANAAGHAAIARVMHDRLVALGLTR